jgi:hypothetical protein
LPGKKGQEVQKGPGRGTFCPQEVLFAGKNRSLIHNDNFAVLDFLPGNRPLSRERCPSGSAAMRENIAGK